MAQAQLHLLSPTRTHINDNSFFPSYHCGNKCSYYIYYTIHVYIHYIFKFLSRNFPKLCILIYNWCIIYYQIGSRMSIKYIICPIVNLLRIWNISYLEIMYFTVLFFSSSILSFERPQPYMFHPNSWNRSTIARPNPCVTPVIITDLLISFRFISLILLPYILLSSFLFSDLL